MNKVSQRARKSVDTPWINSIPVEWSLKPIKTVLNQVSRPVGESAPEITLLSLTQKGVIPRDLESGKGKFPSDFSTYQRIVPQELVFCLFDIDETPRAVGLCSEEGMVTGAYSVFQVKKDNDPKFLSHLFHWIDNDKVLRPYYTGLRKVVRPQTFGSIKIPIPELSEQTAIANFLDRETAKIDTLIAEQERLIELLQEKRQVTISHAVTKGLNPDAQMKDSGVEWLGEVPEHWEGTSIKRISKIYGRIGFRGYTVDDIVDEGDGAIALAPGNLKEKGFSLNKKTYISWEKYEESPEIMIKQGDVLLVKTGSTFGKCCYVDRLNEAATLNPQMVVFKEIIPENEFFYYQLRSTYVQAVIQNMNKGSALPTVTQEAIGSIKLFVPPINEQQSILEHLSKTLIGNEELLDNSRKAISLLSERRSALISAGVTGQIDVRQLFHEEESA